MVGNFVKVYIDRVFWLLGRDVVSVCGGEPFVIFPFLVPRQLGALAYALFRCLSSVAVGLASCFPRVLYVYFGLVLTLCEEVHL